MCDKFAMSSLQRTSIGEALYLGYPCSVDAGVDPVQTLNRYRSEYRYSSEFKNRLHDLFCHILNFPNSISHDELVRRSQRLRDWRGYATAQDSTMMLQDVEVVEQYIKELGFQMHPLNRFLKVINEVDNEHITDIRGFLTSVGQTVKFLYLSGHGLPETVALALTECPADNKTNKSVVWPWDLCRCYETMGKMPYEITSQAKKGDIVVFSSGFLTPEWVIDRIKESEGHGKRNTVIIVIDACFSGCWRDRIATKLKYCALRYAHILVQTSCNRNEVSYGDFFTPLFCWLQRNGKQFKDEASKWITRCYKNLRIEGQSPTFFDSKAQHNKISDPVVRHDCDDKSFYFFNNPYIFYNAASSMCLHRSRNLTRGIPSNRIYHFFNSIVNNLPKKPKIVSCKLNTMHKNGTPLALFLVEWHEQYYHLHLHFYRFDIMVVTGVTHVDVTKQSDKYRPYFIEVGEKNYINSKDHAIWKLIDSNQFANYFIKFMSDNKVNWNQRSSWNMKDTRPAGMIRSRCASLKIKLLTS